MAPVGVPIAWLVERVYLRRFLMLTFTSCMAENMEFVGRAIATYVQQKLHILTRFVDDVPWQERERQFDQGDIQICWICGLPYVWKADQPMSAIELLAVPIMQGARYANRPVYFSDVVVRHDSHVQQFEHLRGVSWAYNEPRSHSGCTITRYHLATLGETGDFFGPVVESGAHQASLRMVLEGTVDASAIDSTVLELELRLNPDLAAQLRVIEVLGPSPIPPWLISTRVAPELRSRLRAVLLQMEADPCGQAILAASGIARFVQASDRDYDPIRHMAKTAARIVL